MRVSALRIGDRVMSDRINRLAADLVAEARKHSLTLGTAESCTAGALTQTLMNARGSPGHGWSSALVPPSRAT